MNGLLCSLTFLLPLLVLASGWYRHSPWSLLPASVFPLVTGLLLPAGQISSFEWLLLGSRLGTDAVTGWLLPASALVWSAAALHHARSAGDDTQAPRFRLFFLLTMCGNLLLLLAQDALSFYVGYALMGLAGYGMLAHRRSTNARVASASYLRWTIAGELLLFSGLLTLVQQAGSTHMPFAGDAPLSGWTLALLVGGLGIKIGLPGLHAWMPGSYAAGNTVTSAVFSGAMANAGILGLLHFLPLQQQAYTTAGMVLLGFGLLGACYGVLLGLPQRRPKVILAYSSISQLGTLAAMLGLALLAPPLAPALVFAVTLYALHHGLSKAALFIALDSIPAARWRIPGMLLLAVLSLSMAGLPLTSGALAKDLLKGALGNDFTWLVSLLAIAAVGTALLMTRFMFACHASAHNAANAVAPAWAAGIALLLTLLAHVALYQASGLPSPGVQAIWPLAVALLLVIAYALLPARAHRALQPVIPKGDIPNLLGKALQRLAIRHPLLPMLMRLRDRLLCWLSMNRQRSARKPFDSGSPPDNEASP